jgi:hypothetical protein
MLTYIAKFNTVDNGVERKGELYILSELMEKEITQV